MAENLLRNSIQISGPEKIVEIDEIVFTRRNTIKEDSLLPEKRVF